jgi:hypothetical protein
VPAKSGTQSLDFACVLILGRRIRGDEWRQSAIPPQQAFWDPAERERIVPTTDSRKTLAAVRDEAIRRDSPPEASSSVRPRTPLFIVASPRPQVGKTFLARLLADFLTLDDGRVRAFEIDPGSDTLAQYLPDVTVTASVSDIKGEMALFDRLVLDDGIAKVIDLGSSAYQRFFSICEEIEFVAECNRQGREPMILFAADEHQASYAAYGNLHRRFPGALAVPVFNEAITKGRQFRHQFPFDRAASVPLRIPILASALRFAADKSHYSFAEFHSQLPMGLPMGSAFELRTWTRRAFLEFRELELRLLLEKLRTALPGVKL